IGTPFDLEQAPLFRVCLVKLSPLDCRLLFCMHHIISDGWSMELLKREFKQYLENGEGIEREPLKLQYRDFAEWQNRAEQQTLKETQGAYWLDVFRGQLPLLELPVDYKRPVIQRFDGAAVKFFISIGETLEESGTTRYMYLLAVFTILMSKLGGQEDIIVGTPVAARGHEDLENIIGMFVNTFALRNYPVGETTFHAFLKDVRTRTLQAFENREYPFEELVEKLSLPRDTGRNPLFDVMFNLLDPSEAPGIVEERGGETGRGGAYRHVKSACKFDMNWRAAEHGKGLIVVVEYNTDLFKPGTIDRIIDYFRRIVTVVGGDPGIKLSDIQLVSLEVKKEKENQFRRDLDFDLGAATIQEKLNHSFQMNSERVAVECGAVRLTYAQLEQRAGAVSHWLAGPELEKGSCIGICSEDRTGIVSLVIGILGAGCVFVPMDTALPEKRIMHMIRAPGIGTLFTDQINEEKLRGICRDNGLNVNIVNIDDSFYTANPSPGQGWQPVPVDGEDKIYIYFTSGTTGVSKAIVGRNRGLLHFIQWEVETFDIKPGVRVSQLIGVAFDAFLRDLLAPLCAGATLCIPARREVVKDRDQLVRWIDEESIGLIHCVPGLFRVFHSEELTPDHFKGLNYILLSGEPIYPGELESWYRTFGERIQLANLYGPTETTMTKTFHMIRASDVHRSRIPIGFPMPGVDIMVLDQNMRPCPPGIVGELYIRTPFRSFGYLNDSQANRQCFPPNPFNNDAAADLVYKTGDLGRELSEGGFEFIGRIDRQVKIRGIRIEPGEIETALLAFPGVRAAVVTAADHRYRQGEKSLCAYVVWETETKVEATIDRLREFLASELPDYMLPVSITPIETIPLTPSGKVDRGALPEPIIAASQYTAPRDPVEEKLADIWTHVLFGGSRSSHSIGIDDNFFELGGHSLNATIVVSRIRKEFHVEFPLTEVFNSPTIRRFGNYIRTTGVTGYREIETVERKEYYPLSSAQERLFFLHRLDETGTGYNMPNVLRVKGTFDLERFESAFNRLILRHESLRTSFFRLGEDIVQRVYYTVGFRVDRWKKEIRDFIRPFDLSRAPLFRVGVIEESPDSHVLIIDTHHIISDGLSSAILVEDFLRLFQGETLPPLSVQYKDFSQWQDNISRSHEGDRQETFWLDQFRGDVPMLDMPLDYTRPTVQSFEGNRLSFEIGEKETAALKELSFNENATLYMVMLALYNVLLSKLSGQEDIVIGTVIAGRRHVGLQRIVGMFVNTLANRNFPAASKSFTDFLKEVRQGALASFENQEYQFEDLVDKVGIERHLDRNPLFTAAMGFNNSGVVETAEVRPVTLPGLTFAPYGGYRRTVSKFDITLYGRETAGHLIFSFEYGTRLFKEETILRFIDYFKQLVSSVLNAPVQPLFLIDILPESEKERLLFDFNDTEAPYPKEKTIHQLFEEQVEKHPARKALVCEEQHLTYGQLDRGAGILAGELRERGIGPDSVVALMVGRSVDMIVGIMGILKAGGAYLPIDPGCPGARVDYILKDSNAKAFVSNGLTVKDPGNANQLPNQQTIKPINQQTNLAYIIYTSGTTGTPKGVMIEHHGITNVNIFYKTALEITEADHILQFADYTFDASVSEIFMALLNGASLYIVDKETIGDYRAFESFLAARAITIATLPPPYLSYLDYREDYALEKLVTAGSETHFDLVDRWSGKVEYINAYGPTETTICAASWSAAGRGEADSRSVSVPIGKPVLNTEIYIIGNHQTLQPVGVPGELCIGGAGVARGYLNNPDLTAEQFKDIYISIKNNHTSMDNMILSPANNNKSMDKKSISIHDTYLTIHNNNISTSRNAIISNRKGQFLNRNSKYSNRNSIIPSRNDNNLNRNQVISSRNDITTIKIKLYCTGDSARWLWDGNIQFLGRIDRQVKIRGSRIEPGEVEHCLNRYGGVTGSLVTIRQDPGGENYLCAYVVLESGEVSALSPYLSKQLPGYMVPSYVIEVDKIPLTASGKVDQKALPQPGPAHKPREYTPPSTPLERQLVHLWSRVLKVEGSSIGVDSDFFSLGGHSLKATYLVSKIREQLQVTIPLAQVFAHPTIRGQAKLIAATAKTTHDPILPVETMEYYPLSPAQERLYFLQRMDPENTAYNIPQAMVLEG
ncbi:MAG: amino acid adenylation domain-containing protein, partial [bacterium]|nr:amino acid adenylation domain-containing protein [bacterium]